MKFFTGTTFTQTVIALPTAISLWPLNANGTDDQAVSNITLTSPETGVSSLRVGDATTSIGFDGTAGYGEAAHASAYARADMTIVGWTQLDTHPTSSQRCIFGKGTGGTHEFQVEQRADGAGGSKLRAYWYDGTNNIFAGSPNGDQALTVDVAFSWALSIGPSGVKLYYRAAGGTWSLVGSDTTVSGSVASNTYALRIGQSPYGGGFLDGVMDSVRIYPGELNLQQLELLFAPVSITHSHGTGPVTGTSPLLPSLATWLTSDEANPASITKYVSNQNRGSGNGSSVGNAQEVQAALNSATAGQTFLAVCQTPGTIEFWNYPTGISFPNTVNFITLQARQGDGVVISSGETYAGSRTSGFWTQTGLSASDKSLGIWRSVSTFTASAANMMGWWIEFDHPHQIVRASDMANIRAAVSISDSPTGYAGPSVHRDVDGKVYLRWARVHPDKYSTSGTWSRNIWPDNPEAVNNSGQIAYPISLDPNNYVIYLTEAPASGEAFRSQTTGGGHYKIGSGINSMGYRGVYGNGNKDVASRRGLHYCRLVAVAGDSTNVAQRFDLQRARYTDGSKRHLARSEWKFGGWLEGIRSVWCGSGQSGAIQDVYAKDCTIADFHELQVLNLNCSGFRWRNCSFFHIYDDAIQSRFMTSRTEIGYCYAQGCSIWGGMGETGSDGADPDPGQWYVHHNIVDMREECGADWRTPPHPNFPALAHSPDGDSPRKNYNNTLLYGPDCEEECGPGFGHAVADPVQNNRAAKAHEVFNNIVVRQSWAGPHNTSQRYDPNFRFNNDGTEFGYSRLFRNQTDYVMEKCTYGAADSNEFWDYNCYYKTVLNPVDGVIRKYQASQGATMEAYASLASWRASAGFTTSKSSGTYRGAYSPGFEGNSTDSAPTMASVQDFPASRFTGYRPSATSVVTTAKNATSLSTENWWSTPPSWGGTYFAWNDGVFTLQPSNFKGALDPAGSTMPIGVQNP